MTLPTLITSAGLTERTPAELSADVVAAITILRPGYTANLPGNLIDDFVGTQLGFLSQAETARSDIIASVSPFGANIPLIYALGSERGLVKGGAANTSVYVTFTGTVGYVISTGFVVSDGSHQYAVKTGGVIGSSGSVILYCLALSEGSWAIPANSVTSLITSVPGSIALTCINALDGLAGESAETVEAYRARVLEAGLSSSVGMARQLRTLLNAVTGVQSRLIGIKQGNNGWKIIVGGGDSYEVANAIFNSVFDPTVLIPSIYPARNVTVNITDYPDVYTIIWVQPVLQQVKIKVTWNTSVVSYVSDSAIATLAQQPLTDYINGLYQSDSINVYDLQNIFQDSIASAVPPQQLSKMLFEIKIDDVIVAPTSGTSLIHGDSEGYFSAIAADITFERG
jgi:hypothetical protein